MNDETSVAESPAEGRPLISSVVAWIFTLTTFLSAILLFSVQPMFAKMALPVLGGSPSVWAVALCFFQGALVVGYGYAHLVTRYVGPRYSGFVHLGVMLLAMLALPIGIRPGWTDPPPGDPYVWQIGMFAAGVGLPFVAIAANAPLLQAWFARSGHSHARDPYFLYAASNLGSLLALLAYPFVLEPAFGLTALSRFWTVGFAGLWGVIAVSVVSVRRLDRNQQEGAGSDPDLAEGSAPSWPRRLTWMGLALVPSALLTAFTTHIATDVASAPLLWVLPLALYLLTFILVFRDRPITWLPLALTLALGAFAGFRTAAQAYQESGVSAARLAGATAIVTGVFSWFYFRGRIARVTWLRWGQVIAVAIALLQLSQTTRDTWMVSAAAGVAAFLLSSLVAHRTLYESRPAARYLTEFYFLMSLGGVLGGLFSALVAPRLFSEVMEYPILLALTMACRPNLRVRGIRGLLRAAAIFVVGLAAIHWGVKPLVSHHLYFTSYEPATTFALVFGLAMLVCFRAPAFQVVAAFLMCAAVVMLPSTVNRADAITTKRSYFGVYRVAESEDHDFQILIHGTTLHGAQRIRDAAGDRMTDYTPATYYYPDSPMAETIDTVRERLRGDGRLGHYAVVGLGTGSLSCYAQPGERWRFFEIDPVIVGISSNPANFGFLSHCQPHADIVLGDARRTLSKQDSESFDLIIVDAFSSDAIPMHLLTAEAIRMYAEKLTPSGIVLLHTSNRYLDLDAVLGATLPLVPELDGILLTDDDADDSYASSKSTVGVFSKDPAAIDVLRGLDSAKALERGTLRGWTDDYSDVLGPFLARLSK